MHIQPTDLRVNLHDRSYTIHIGADLLSHNLLRSYIKGQQVLIITNEKVAPLYLELLQSNLTDLQCDSLVLPDGEAHKTLETISVIFDHLIKHGHRRDTTLIALGGGVVGDMTGFAASCYQRGVDFIQIPTTLLAQVDASVGGKTAVNHPRGKNMIGSFYQPNAVLIDINTLNTLPLREFCCGLAEIIKAAIIADQTFFGWLENHITQLVAKNLASVSQAISQACAIKIKVVESDEREQGQRAILNFGHTFAHGLEQWAGYSQIQHGEAVAIGMVLALDYSRRIGYIDRETVQRVKNILTMANLPIRLPSSITSQQLMHCMGTDKKVDQSGLRLVLSKGIGQAVISSRIDRKVLEETIAANIIDQEPW